MAVLVDCECCGRPTPRYRMASVIYDGRIAQLCPRCVATQSEHVDIPYAPRADQGAIQPSTSREAW